MNMYIDDDSAEGVLVKLLRAAGHDVVVPEDIGYAGRDDSQHMQQAVAGSRVLLTKNYDDYQNLHDLILICGGHHPGILAIRQDKDRKRNMSPKAIVRAVERMIALGVAVPDGYHILNDFR
ncbi:MAG: DUF5615 family PIN-like protein [Gemmataceae bacterium]